MTNCKMCRSWLLATFTQSLCPCIAQISELCMYIALSVDTALDRYGKDEQYVLSEYHDEHPPNHQTPNRDSCCVLNNNFAYPQPSTCVILCPLRTAFLRPRLHGNAYGKTHRINANAIAKKLPSTRNIHRIVSSHTRQLRLHPTAGKAAVHMPNLYVAL